MMKRRLSAGLKRNRAQVVVLRLQKRFGLRDMLSDYAKDRVFIASFLNYFGVLTLAGETERGELCLKVPNLVMQSMYVERVQRMMLPDPLVRDRGLDAAKRVYQFGEIAPVCRFVETVYLDVFSNRDYALFNELTLKTCFLTLLYNDLQYIMDSEPELKRRYADLTMIIRPDRRHLKIFDVLIEFKFVKLKDLGLSGETVRSMPLEKLLALSPVSRTLSEGKAQVTDYGGRLADKYRDLCLKKFVVTAVGVERICFLEV
jgi:hypothetical protein